MHNKSLIHPSYRPDIDGLRAIAILSVVLFHAFPGTIKGGFIGVDIFFVISGFLISSIIFSSQENDRFSFITFYSRRIRRIFPALTLVLIACLVFGWFSLLSDEYKQLGKHIAGGAGFLANYILWGESGYFDNLAETKPLLHLWSLGIEEQFYIFWPVVLWFAWRSRLNRITILFSLAAISFFLNIKTIKSDSVAAFYSPQTRFWELLIGSTLAYFSLHKHDILKVTRQKLDLVLERIVYTRPIRNDGRTLANIQSLFGAILIAMGLCLITNDRLFPGYWALMPTFGTFLIIAAGSQAYINRVILSNRLLVWVGLISFPFYLWHWPLLSFAHIIEGETPSKVIRISVIFLAIFLSWLTTKLVERPFRFGGQGQLKTVPLLVVMIVTGSLGYYTFINHGLPSRVKAFEKISKATSDWEGYKGYTRETINNNGFMAKHSNLQQITMFVGNSNAVQYAPRVGHLIEIDPNHNYSAIFVHGEGCFPIRNIRGNMPPRCDQLMERAYLIATSKYEVKRVVIAGLWDAQFKRGTYTYSQNGQHYIISEGSIGYKLAISEFASYIKELIKNGKEVYVILSIPSGTEFDPKSMAKRSLAEFPNIFRIQTSGISRDNLERKYGKINQDLKKAVSDAGAKIIDPKSSLCTTTQCQAIDEHGEPIFKDSVHLRATFVRERATFIDPVMKP
ncbi:acyltransferase family protein [Chitinibacter sp. S2-10]|uniref:acyltransferase family protein n=1 Tax=Chitinibacter sp. S2-10 TaxID=3373597 RepID=UPI003977A4C0